MYLKLFLFILLISLPGARTWANPPDGPRINLNEEFDYEYLERLTQNQKRTYELLINSHFYDFVQNLSIIPEERSQRTFQILRNAVNSYIFYLDSIKTDSYAEEVINEVNRILKAANQYFLSQNNEVSARYFHNIKKDLAGKILDALNEKDRARGIIDTTKSSMFDLHHETILRDSLKYKIAMEPGKPATIEYKDTLLELSVRELPALRTEANVVFLGAQDIKRRIFSIKVLQPSSDSSEAVFLTTKHLLNFENVHGVLFDDVLRIPLRMQSIAHEIRSLNDKVLVIKPACSGLFN